MKRFTHLFFVIALLALTFSAAGVSPAKADTTTGLILHWTFDEGSGTVVQDQTANDLDGTILGTRYAWSTEVPPGIGSTGSIRLLGLDDSNTWVQSAQSALFPSGNSPRTLCAWAKSEDGVLESHAEHMVNYGQALAGQAFGFMIYTGNTWWFYGHDPVGDINSGVTPNTDWHHQCVTHNGTTVRYYLDGNQIASGPRTLTTTANTRMVVGVRPDFYFDTYFDGWVDDVRLYDRALTPEDITELHAGSVDLDVSGTYDYIRSQPALAISSALTATSSPAGQVINGANVLIGAGFLAGDTLAVTGYASPWNGISWSYNAAAGALAFTGNSSVDNYQTLLRAVTFSTSATIGARTVDFTLGAARPDSGTGHYYEYVHVGAGNVWSNAKTAAEARSYFGRQGYLATIASAGENAFVTSKLGGNGAWIGGSDAATEGTWQWVTGPETGTTFCIDPITGDCAPVGGAYTNWDTDAGEPNNSLNNEHYLQILAGSTGKWNDLPDVGYLSYAVGYVVEYGGMAGDSPMDISGSVTVNVVDAVVTFDAQGGSPTSANQNLAYGALVTEPAAPTRAGYTFNGWFTAASGGAQWNFASDTVTGDMTLYAQWTAVTSYTVTFDPNGGSGSMAPQTASVPTPLNLNTFTRSGYTFSGWNTAANGSGTPYADGATYAFAADITLYAQWSTDIPSSWVGGITIQSSQPVVAVGRPHLGSEIASYVGVTVPSTTQYLPMLFKSTFAGNGYNAALYVQNMSASTTGVTLEFVSSSGAVVYTKTDSLGPNASRGYWLPAEAGLPNGFAGGVKVTADQPILAMGRPHINGQVMTYNGFGTGSTTAWLPMYFKNGFGNYNTALYIQNVTGNSADLTIQYINLDGTVACAYADTLAANASKGYWSLQVTCDTGSLPSGFVGGVKVTSTQNILTVARPHLGTQITSYNGLAGGAQTAYVPMLFRRAFAGGSYNAALYLQNVSGSSADVVVEYVDNAGAVAATQNVTLASGAIGSIWLPSVAGLPDGFVGGARITANQNIIAVGRPHLGAEITAYNGAPLGSLNAYLPMLFKNAFVNYQSAFYIQNTTGNTANVNISFYNESGMLSCIKSVTLAPNATQGFWMPTVSCAP